MSACDPLDLQALQSDAFFSNPYPVYAHLRARPGPFWLPHRQATHSKGVWLFSRYDDALAVFKRTQGISKSRETYNREGVNALFDLNMLHRDGADHLRLRRLVSRYFSAQAIERLRPEMQAVAGRLLDAFAHRNSFDLIAEFAEPLPLAVIARLIGVPEHDMARIRAWSKAFSPGFDSVLSSDDVLAQQRRAMDEFFDYVSRLLNTRAAQGDNTLRAFLQQCGSEAISEDEKVAMLGFLLFAGHETTINLIGNAALLLHTHPEQYALLRDNPRLLESTIEEVLRFESPEQRTSFRILTEPASINGQQLDAGEQIGVIIGSANRDERVFKKPDHFDITRRPNPHVAFGIGMHNCLGKILARIQAKVAIEALVATPQLLGGRFCSPAPDWQKNSFFRGLRTLRLAREAGCGGKPPAPVPREEGGAPLPGSPVQANAPRGCPGKG